MIFGMHMTSAETAPYGEWPSPISGADVARKQIGLAFPTMVGTSVWWQEARPADDGRQAVVFLDPDGAAGRPSFAWILTGLAGTYSPCRGTPGPACTNTAASPSCRWRMASSSRTS